MSEKMPQSKKKTADQDRGVINIGDISSISGGTINVSGGDFRQESRAINTQGGVYIEGNVDTGGGDFIGRDQYNVSIGGVESMAQLFRKVYTAIEADSRLTPPEKEDLIADVKDVQTEVAQGGWANESLLTRRLRNIQRMSPDILDLVFSTLANPTVGASMVVRKIADKIKDANRAE